MSTHILQSWMKNRASHMNIDMLQKLNSY